MTTHILSPLECQLLLNEHLSTADAERLLSSIGFADWRAAGQALRRLAHSQETKNNLLSFLPTLLLEMETAASPDRVLVNIERFAGTADNRRALFRTLAQNPRAVEILVTVIAGSQFLTEILLRTPTYFDALVAHRHLAQTKNRADFETSAAAQINPDAPYEEQLNALRHFQRWELLRIGTCDLLGLFDMPTVTAQLSHLADSLVSVCLHLVAAQTQIDPAGFVVLGMGKLGGQELNYSSDIDLLFLSANGDTCYQRLGKRLIDALTRVTAAGFLYRVDMRLRPWGKVGSLVTSVAGHITYLKQHARLWEKQALLKARVVAGDAAVGEAFLQQATPLIFAAAAETVQADVREMKTRIENHLRQKGRAWGEVKLGEGSIRDIEFVTQYLQLAHGDTHPHVRSRNTLNGLARLATAGFISPADQRILAEGYTFLRSVEHWLQMMHYRQTHTLPTTPQELTYLARRLGFNGADAGAQFTTRYTQHTTAIRTVYRRYLNPTAGTATDQPPHVQKHIARLAPAYVSTFSEQDIARHAALAERLTPQNLAEVEAIPLPDGNWQVTIVGFDYLGELSIICGLFFVHGFNIHAGDVFTYRPQPHSAAKHHRPLAKPVVPPPTKPPRGRRKIIDVFIVSRTQGDDVPPDLWQKYTAELRDLLHYLETDQQQKAQGTLAQRLATLYHQRPAPTHAVLYPIDIEIDNTSSPRNTILRIDTMDTVGFLYELTNALALVGVHITRVSIGSEGNRVSDKLHITSVHGQKITTPNKLRELRAAIVLTKHFTHLLPRSPNPGAALVHFRQFLSQLFAQPNWPNELVSLEQPKVLDALTRLLGVSDFLWTDFLRMQYVNLFPVLQDATELATRKTTPELQAQLQSILANVSSSAAKIAALNAFKDREMFRIDMRHILRYITVSGQFSAELTDLADVVVTAAFNLCWTELTAQFGHPLLHNGRPCPVSVCALGKCGGRELGFASDIELIFIYAGNGHTDGSPLISTAEFYEKLVQAMVSAIHAKREGIFELDLRLRPYGKFSTMAVPLDSFRTYYALEGSAWAYERQALVKLRPVAGDADLGRKIVALRDEIVYAGEPFDVAAMRGMRERQVRHLVTPGTINVKHSPGGLVDVEYLVQGLQITHGANNPALRLTNTREAMIRLADVGLLSRSDFARLLAAHKFLRRLINALRMVRGHAKDLTVPPTDSDDFAFLARRLNYGDDTAGLQQDLTMHTDNVQKISARLLG